jgi:polysaccharide biosynthesis protein PslG
VKRIATTAMLSVVAAVGLVGGANGDRLMASRSGTPFWLLCDGTGCEETQPPTTTVTVTEEPFGFSTGSEFTRQSGADIARSLDGVQASGADWLRVEMDWNWIQGGGPRSYRWAPFDRIARGAEARGIELLYVPLFTPPWARAAGTTHEYPPTNLSTYARFCRAAVRRFAPMGVHHWEIWNEPNIPFWKPAPDPVHYAALLKLAYSAIKAEDPSALVVSAGLSPYGAYGQATATSMNPVTFLEKMYAAGVRGSFDAVGWHPYEWGVGTSFHPASAWSQLVETSERGVSPSARSVMVANGDAGKQIWVTEIGAPTNLVGLDRQAQLVRDFTTKWGSPEWDEWTGPLTWYTFRDGGTDQNNLQHHFGVLRRDWSQKPAYAPFKGLTGS